MGTKQIVCAEVFVMIADAFHGVATSSGLANRSLKMISKVQIARLKIHMHNTKQNLYIIT